MHKADFKALNTWLVRGRDKDERWGAGGGDGAILNTKDNLFTYPKLFSIQIHIRFQISISISNTLDLKSSICTYDMHHFYLSYLVKHLLRTYFIN